MVKIMGGYSSLVLIREALRTGTFAGLAMIPFAAAFRAWDLRINEYGAKTLALLIGEVAAPLHYLLTLAQHLLISWLVAAPLLIMLSCISRTRGRILAGLLYGAGFYVAVNSLALPFAFGDPTPWELGLRTVYPSLVVHLVFGFVVALLARPTAVSLPNAGRRESRTP